MTIARQESVGGTSRQRENFEKKGRVASQLWRKQDGENRDEVTSHMKEYRFKNMGSLK